MPFFAPPLTDKEIYKIDFGFAWRDPDSEIGEIHPCPLQPSMRLYKLHGSINWRSYRGREKPPKVDIIQYGEDQQRDDRFRLFPQRRHLHRRTGSAP